MSKTKIVIFATAGITTNMLYHGISDQAEILQVIIEHPISIREKTKRRFRKIGVFKTLGQLAFLAMVKPFISSKNHRIKSIMSEYNLSQKSIPENLILNVDNVHSQRVMNQLKALKPELIVINGTRILKRDFIAATPCPIVNIHVGITPKYRGVHGGYWALYNNEQHLFGVTLHEVDQGIDSGEIIAQKILEATAEDNFKTYPILQYAGGIQCLRNYLEKKERNDQNEQLTSTSSLWYHPTIWQYLFGKVK